ncbi:RluA family pseudouridine synthase [Bombilactobacillus thymidiniphilus]|uniref:RNA pseudouridylate synthase n=1 Tax=Bombilactobacillus thymidiniphilus TaxID=2923363 RepID=A0ABY4PC41_9LACO|nr:RluA family pseudouridine synthase [Bombilactobacillus thymidiniphilus]UQS83338.1 RluA family pseudouridine synthase [Bombilactobacillus thymidiniphilus]
MLLERQLNVEPAFSGLTVRQLLNTWCIPRKWQHELRIQHGILVNGQYRYFNQTILAGDQIQLHLQTNIKPQVYLANPKHDFKVVYEDADLLIVNKPAGLKTHPNSPKEKNTLFNQLTSYLPTSPLMLHRLDMLTSGLIMIGKNPLIVPIIERQLAKKQLQRTYVAITPYKPDLPTTGHINAKIGADLTDPRKRRVDPKGQTALTDYRILQHNQNLALLQLQLQTGRTHQIRVHLQAIQAPIIGDPLYNNQTASRLYLHAYKLRYQIPFSSSYRQINLSIPSDFLQLVK